MGERRVNPHRRKYGKGDDKRRPPEHESERMEMKSVADGAQYRITCKKCGATLTIAANKQRNGRADCTGKEISVAWGSA
jgi:hypothetical protein